MVANLRKLMIAGVTSGAGKTSVTLGLLKLLVQQGYQVQPYKVGPDYVDTKFHTRITGRPSRNLDSFLTPQRATLAYLFKQKTADIDYAVVEGVMGLYDGLGTDKDCASSSAIAKLLDLPVVLVLDGKATSTSTAAIVQGYVNFDPAVNIVGVVVNNVLSANHFKLIKGAIERYTDIPVLGCLPRDPQISLPSRQLGLVPDAELANIDQKIERIAKLLGDHLDLPQLLKLAALDQTPAQVPFQLPKYQLRLGIARDDAFNFYYQDNLDLLQRCGVTLVPFSPMHDQHLPAVDALYLGGGYPEEFAAELANNQTMRQAIADFSQQNRPIYAECGGLMYLGEKLKTTAGEFPMVGVLAGHSEMTPRLKRFGYCYATAQQDTLLVAKGQRIAGHEFHHSLFHATGVQPLLELTKERDGQVVDHWTGGYQVRRTFASYVHVHFYQNPQLLQHLLQEMGAVTRGTD